jgi:hypothetical protein
MKIPTKTVTAASYTAGIGVIASAIVLTVLLVLSLLGLIHPRQTRITLQTNTITRPYDGTTVVGSTPNVRFGNLHPDHQVKVLNLPEHSAVGTYANAPEYVILDAAGADVTNQYDITENFGNIVIEPLHIVLYAPNQSKVYDGTPLESKDVMVWGDLAPGETFRISGVNSLILPGQEPIAPTYAIVTADGVDVTDQYIIEDKLGTLTVHPIPLAVSTAYASAHYTGQSLSDPGWKQTSGQLLEGHRLAVTNTTVLQDVGSIPNEATATVLDQNGKDVSHLYDIRFTWGKLTILPISLTVTTAGMEKVYDGKDLTCPQWTVTEGTLPADHRVTVLSSASLNRVGTVDNTMSLRITDPDGRDVTYRYDIRFQYGTLTVQPRPLTIKTGSAQKVYDGTALQCNEYEILSGSLCPGDVIELLCIPLVEPGYSDNSVVSCNVFHIDPQGDFTDVTACYRITYEYGSLTILLN